MKGKVKEVTLEEVSNAFKYDLSDGEKQVLKYGVDRINDALRDISVNTFGLNGGKPEHGENGNGKKYRFVSKAKGVLFKRAFENSGLNPVSDRERSLRKKRIDIYKPLFKSIMQDALSKVVQRDGKEGYVKEFLVDKVINDTLDGTITFNTLKGFETIRDTIGEKPIDKIITAGIEQRVIDINITREKVDKVKKMLEAINASERKVAEIGSYDTVCEEVDGKSSLASSGLSEPPVDGQNKERV